MHTAQWLKSGSVSWKTWTSKKIKISLFISQNIAKNETVKTIEVTLGHACKIY